ncbi:MAG: hypothetical protein ACREIA_12775 [Opitutaceae bacterium]
MLPSPTPPVLVIDSASQEVIVGLEGGAGSTRDAWARRSEEAGIAVFTGVRDVLRETGVTLAQLGAIVFCEGPGSLLGIRMAAMAIRTWVATRPAGGAPLEFLYYLSVVLVAADLLYSEAAGTAENFAVITDARRSMWNALDVSANDKSFSVQRLSAGDLEARDYALFHPEGFARWQPLPAQVQTAAYRPERVLTLARKFPLLRPSAQPDAFLTQAPEYQKSFKSVRDKL